MSTSDLVTIIAAIISGGLTLMGVLITLHYYRIKDKRIEKDKRKEELAALNETRPKLICDSEIKEFKYTVSFIMLNTKNPQEDVHSIIFKLVNNGIKSIKKIFVCSNFPNFIMITDKEQNDEAYQNNKKQIDVIIREGDTICLNIKFNGLVNEMIAPFVSLWLVDEDDIFWSQGLYCSTGEITNSTLRTDSEVREMIIM